MSLNFCDNLSVGRQSGVTDATCYWMCLLNDNYGSVYVMSRSLGAY